MRWKTKGLDLIIQSKFTKRSNTGGFVIGTENDIESKIKGSIDIGKRNNDIIMSANNN